MVDQDLEEYGITKQPNMGNRYMIKGAEKEEEELIKKVMAWWKTNSKKYGVEPAATKPAE